MRQFFTILALLGGVIVMVMLSVATVHYLKDPEHYVTGFLNIILMPFIVTCIVTLFCGLVAFMCAEEGE